jgi:hypothetical protein
VWSPVQIRSPRPSPPRFFRVLHDPRLFEIHLIPSYVPAGADSAHGIFHKWQVGFWSDVPNSRQLFPITDST